ncbi:MAG: histidinol-phosphate transaminase [Anaerovoracaceae bacterium]|jgi:histidinol-phosphate aminotransferase
MSSFIDKKFASLEEYVPGEQPRGKKVIKLNTNEAPYPVGPKTAAAVNRELALGLRRYNDPESAALKKKLAEVYGVGPENVFVSNGSDETLNLAFLAFSGDGVCFPDITYGFYQVFAELYQKDAVEIPLKEDLSIDPADYENAGRMVVLANPNAPTGQELSVEQIERILQSNPEHVVLIDEAYADFGTVTLVPLIKKYDNLLVVRTYSKSRAVAGARLGYAFADPGIIRDLEKLKFSTNPYNVNSMTAAAGIAALTENDYYEREVENVKKIREWETEQLRALGFHVLPSRANFLFAEHPKIGGAELNRLLRERGILVRHFDNPRIIHYNRITIGTEQEMNALNEALKDILRTAE